MYGIWLCATLGRTAWSGLFLPIPGLVAYESSAQPHSNMEEPHPPEKRPSDFLGGLSLFVMLAALLADQLSKALVLLTMYPGQSIPESGIFRLTYVKNTGSAFGLFPNQTLFLIFASFVGIAILLVFYRIHRVSGPILRISLGLQLGGAIGNLMDRLRLGYVVDFLDVGAWPVFNLADSAIVVGLVGLMITMLRTNSPPERYSASEAFLFPVALEQREDPPSVDAEMTPVTEDTGLEAREEQWKKSVE